MFLELLRAKIHRVKVTDLELNYVGSITIDQDLIEAVGFLPHEKVQVVNVNNGERFETYIIVGERGTGVIGLNGPAARLAMKGDILIVMSYAWMSREEALNYQPAVIYPDGNNRLEA